MTAIEFVVSKKFEVRTEKSHKFGINHRHSNSFLTMSFSLQDQLNNIPPGEQYFHPSKPHPSMDYCLSIYIFAIGSISKLEVRRKYIHNDLPCPKGDSTQNFVLH